MIFILGGEGYVGSAYARLCGAKGLPHTVITRKNYESLVGASCDVFVNANGNSRKFMAERDPKWEFDASVRSVVHALEDFKSGVYVQLSTGDVYPDQSRTELTREESAINPQRQSRYGLHKHLAEQTVLARHPRALVIRMGGFVGYGMKKNAIFDMLHDQPVWLTPDSELQFIQTDTAARLVWALLDAEAFGEVVNLGARGVVRIGDIHERLGSQSAFSLEARSVRFELSIDKLARLTGGPLPDAKGEVGDFLSSLGR